MITLVDYSDLPEVTRKHLAAIEDFIGDVDGKDTIDDETIDAEDAVVAFNGLVELLRAAGR